MYNPQPEVNTYELLENNVKVLFFFHNMGPRTVAQLNYAYEHTEQSKYRHPNKS